MRGAILLYGSSKNDRDNKIENIILSTESKIENNPDVLFIVPEPDKKTIGIEQTRGLIKYITQKPFSSRYKYIIIPEAHKMSIPAQNSLLKTLEEPPLYATIILSAKTQKSLLPTVVSRCQRVEVKKLVSADEYFNEDSENNLKKLKQMTLGERLLWADETSKEERTTIIELFEDFIVQEREELLNNAASSISLSLTENIELLTDIKKDIEETNVNLKLSLEYFVMRLE